MKLNAAKLICLFTLLSVSYTLMSQSATVTGTLEEDSGIPVMFANVALYDTSSTILIKVETSDKDGYFKLSNIKQGLYNLKVTYVGLSEISTKVAISNNGELSLGTLVMGQGGIELAETVVTAQRVMVEVKPDRTVFNVDGTINSVGSDALELLRKAPGVTVDNNDNINVLGRFGVLLYVDGKKLPLVGDDLTNYLQSLPAEQIDKIDIISSPGAKYEAEGNAGIIDIRLKKAENIGANGTISGTFSQGKRNRGNLNISGNSRSSKINSFGAVGFNTGTRWSETDFFNLQNNISLDETEKSLSDWNGYNYRLGLDYFLNKKHTIGFLIGGRSNDSDGSNISRIAIAPGSSPSSIDSILVANNTTTSQRDQNTYNLNYMFQSGDNTSLNIDLDYGTYRKGRQLFQPNQYFNPSESAVLSEVINSFDTPSDIDISTFKIDFETEGFGGTIGLGSKLSKVVSDNTFIANDVINGTTIRDDQKSNKFKYDEKVYAGYLSYKRSLSESVKLSLGVRAEQTDATGDLKAFASNLSEPPVLLNYLSWFPNAGLTWQMNRTNVFNLGYSRRINRPDYNVLNPFRFQLSEISFRKGNPFLNPEIVNNVELGYTANYRYNFKLSYSVTTDQITRLIAPDKDDLRANFISYDNLADQTVIGFNASLPVDVTDIWNMYTNLSAAYIDNQADYGDGAIVDIQAFTYTIFQQNSIKLPGGYKAEVSGYFAGPGVWGGVFEYGVTWSLNLGLQKKFLDDQLNVKLSANDLFFQSGWSGQSIFDGLVSTGQGRYDSRRVSLSLSYNFGNQKVKSRKRKTGLEDEAGRVGS